MVVAMAQIKADSGTDRRSKEGRSDTKVSFFDPDAVNVSTTQLRNLRAPRYTSYPTADQFNQDFGPEDYARHLRGRSEATAGLLSVYVHVPFCESLCYYCACNKTITRNRNKGERFLNAVAKEVDLVTQQLGGELVAAELHLGGGTPTWLTDNELERLDTILRRGFDFKVNAERSIEIDPRTVGDQTIERLAALGFNRISIGVQDLDHRVQVAINRVQARALTQQVMERARETGYRSINLDLVYGLPYQTPERFARTIESIIELRPDRVALFNYAHMPHVFKAQRRIAGTTLPNVTDRLTIAENARQRLEQAGYISIGLDHFALPEDELAIAAQSGRLHRNFQGYCTSPDHDTIALGPSAISQVGVCYAQNERGFEEWRKRILGGTLATCRGVELSRDDHIRRSVINAIMCNGHIDTDSLSIAWLIDFQRYFAAELKTLQTLQLAGLVTVDKTSIDVTPKGHRIALRLIASVFDKNMDRTRSENTHSHAS